MEYVLQDGLFQKQKKVKHSRKTGEEKNSPFPHWGRPSPCHPFQHGTRPCEIPGSDAECLVNAHTETTRSRFRVKREEENPLKTSNFQMKIQPKIACL
jgi:hypothetical protein